MINSTMNHSKYKSPSSSYHVVPHAQESSSLNSIMMPTGNCASTPETFRDNYDRKSCLLLQQQHQQQQHQQQQDEDRSITTRSTCTNNTVDGTNDKETSFLWQSLLSNVIFLCAGSLYMTASCWDIVPPNDEDSAAIMVYIWIGRLAPMTYLLNSLIDIKLAHRIRVHRKRIRDTNTHNNTYNSISNNNTNSNKRNSFEKMRKHAAHRRELSAALTFFLAALFGTLCVIVEAMGRSDNLLEIFERISIHLYMLSALLAFFGSAIIRGQCHCQKLDMNDSSTLENLGDLFFLIGSIVDMILCDFHFDDDIVWWPIVSSLLWCIDAMFYLKSDLSSLKLKSNNSNHNSNTLQRNYNKINLETLEII